MDISQVDLSASKKEEIQNEESWAPSKTDIRILKDLWINGPSYQLELADRLPLPRSTVNQRFQILLKERSIEEIDRKKGHRGKNPQIHARITELGKADLLSEIDLKDPQLKDLLALVEYPLGKLIKALIEEGAGETAQIFLYNIIDYERKGVVEEKDMAKALMDSFIFAADMIENPQALMKLMRRKEMWDLLEESFGDTIRNITSWKEMFQKIRAEIEAGRLVLA